MTKAIIFDLDGTLGDTLPLCIEAFRKSISPLAGKELTYAEIIATFGPSEEGTVRRLIPDHYDEGLHSYWKWYADLHSRCPDPFPGAVELLEDLAARGFILALVTGKAERSAEISLAHFKMGRFFQAREYGSPEGPSKDAGIRRILEKFGLEPEDAVYIGDAPSDVFYARKVGVPVISAAWAETSDLEELKAMEPDHVFSTIDELRTHLLTIPKSEINPP
jgi:Predicted phosphatases